MTMREAVLDEAKLIVSKDRNTEYGEPEVNFARIAELWSAYKQEDFQLHDVAVMMMLVKVARIATSPYVQDHWIDIAGYSACGAEVGKRAFSA